MSTSSPTTPVTPFPPNNTTSHAAFPETRAPVDSATICRDSDTNAVDCDPV